MTKWEYKVVTFPTSFWNSSVDYQKLQDALDQFGREGWELINMFDTNKNGYTTEVVAIFKRPT